MNARFWTRWRDSWVKLTLRPQQSLEASSFRHTDEGFSSEAERWTHDGEGVHLEWMDDGRDCDGRLTRGGEAYCPLAHLQSEEVYPPEPGIRFPAWQAAKRYQRDEFAEAAGY